MIGISRLVRRINDNRMEWALLAVIAAVCGVLSFLQCRWTGELSRAEPALLRVILSDQLRRLSQRFNNDIREDCTSFVAIAREVKAGGNAETIGGAYAQWAAAHDRTVFSRLGIAFSDDNRIALRSIDPAGRVVPLEWSAEWQPLKSAMASRLEGTGRPPNVRPDSNLIEIPLFGHSGSEDGWIIFQLNEDYLRTSVLPKLIAEYLSPLQTTYDVSVANSLSGDLIFSTNRSTVTGKADATSGLLPSDILGLHARVHGRGHGERDETRWIIAVRHHGGSLEDAVAAVRRKNLIASLILVGLLGGTGLALVQYTRRSRRLAEMQFQFAAGISHDLRTPLTAIRGAAFNLAEGVVTEPAAVARYLRLILRNADELTAMISNVLAFSTTLRPSKSATPEAVSVGDILRHAVDVMAPEIEQGGCHIETNIAGDLPAIAADRMAVDLVFRNLIGNAARHAAGGKWIGVSAAPAGEVVEVQVCDRGPGIPEAEKERVFEPFYRGDKSRTSRVPGTGLGLSLVKSTIENYKGTVEVNNLPGGGARFIVRLPVFHPTS